MDNNRLEFTLIGIMFVIINYGPINMSFIYPEIVFRGISIDISLAKLFYIYIGIFR